MAFLWGWKVDAFVVGTFRPNCAVDYSKSSIFSTSDSSTNANDDQSNDPEQLRRKAEELREQIRKMEETLNQQGRRATSANNNPITETKGLTEDGQRSLRNKRVLVVGANGRLGSMVCRHLLRHHSTTEVVAGVHYIGENSPTSRGYARLSYEVGAEDGSGSIGPAWSSTDRTATFAYDPSVMEGYNLQNLRLVECELLDPVQCQTIAEGCDAVIWCATDFNGNTPRAVGSLDLAFLFRAVTRPTKGRVEVEGVQNMLGALKLSKRTSSGNDPVNFIHVSMAPGTYSDFETSFGSFWGIKSLSEQIVRNDFPSLTKTILQFGAYDDNFVEEGRELQCEEYTKTDDPSPPFRRINRRDAARAAVEALLREEWQGKTIQVWTATQ